jgi:Predicted acyl-CoA transferases/carnitine dehydratase
VPVADCVSAVYAAFGAMMALLERQRSGRGQVVDTALYETMFSMMEGAVPTFDRLKLAPQRMGTRLPAMAPNNLYLAGDETYVLIAANSDAVFARLAAAMDRPALVHDPRYASAGARWQHVDELDAEVGAWVASLPAAEVETRLIAHGVPTSRVVTLPEIFDEPHYREREMLVELPHPKLGKVTVQGVVPRLSATPGRVRWLGEPAGARTRTILRDWLNLDDAAIDTLLQNGVIAEAGAEGGGTE